VYSGTCQYSGVVPKGCPDKTRIGRTLSAACDTTAMKCQAAVTATGCSNPSMCDMQPITDLAGQTCNVGECTCYQAACYRRCSKDLDCAAGYNCDQGTSVCTKAPDCTSDAYCADQLASAAAQCRSGKCVIACKTDYDCNPDGLFSSFDSQVCNAATGACQDIGCAADSDCPGTPSGVKVFCVTPPTGTAAVAVRSAITDGR
jgi:hypothetical protein